jgi:hypothetical protein
MSNDFFLYGTVPSQKFNNFQIREMYGFKKRFDVVGASVRDPESVTDKYQELG